MPISDSPWFWLFVFGGMGLVALVTVSPKYARRQERLERMHQTRQRVAAAGGQVQAEAQASKPRQTGSPLAARTGPTKPALRPLALALALLLFIAALVMLGRRLNQRLTGEPADLEAPG
ncbi:MAG: hypothetical protein WD847_10335 [Pirellulales bacterium]